MLGYNKNNIIHAKENRKNLTPWERKLWYRFLRSYPVRFQRQKAIDDFIVDFYCAKARIVIELDGSEHYKPDKEVQDRIRSDVLGGYKLYVLRFTNLDIDKNFDGVCMAIDCAVKERLVQFSNCLSNQT